MRFLQSSFCLSILIFFFGCSTIESAYDEFRSKSNTTQGAIVGGSAGAVIGTVLGSQVGNPVEGMVLGAAAGSGVGALVGSAIDRKIEQTEKNVIEKDLASLESERDLIVSQGLETSGRLERVALGDRFFEKIHKSSNSKFALRVNQATNLNNTQESVERGIKTIASAEAGPSAGKQNVGGLNTSSSFKRGESNEIQNEFGPSTKAMEAELPQKPRNPSLARKVEEPSGSQEKSGLLESNPYSNRFDTERANFKQKVDKATDVKQEPAESLASSPNQQVSERSDWREDQEVNLSARNNSKSLAEAKPADVNFQASDSPSQAGRAVESPSEEIKSACNEGYEELKKAAEATEFSSKLFHTRRAVRICENFTPGKLALVKLYIDLKRYEDAKFELDNILKTEPDNLEAKNLYKIVDQQMKQ
ncbi:MAG: glycine zipper domain-containing protein [Deltaproteobacteria bacterium]|nr:glycine zipper domain-containing protein [Deltaproteobacteria bacterium]